MPTWEDNYNEFGDMYGKQTPGSAVNPNPYAPRLPKDPNEPSSARANPYAGISAQDLANRLRNKPGQVGGMNAAELEWAIKNGFIDPTLANNALIQKDAMMAGSGRAWGVGSPQPGVQVAPSMYGTWTPPETEINPAQYNNGVLGWQAQALPDQYRGGAEGWLRQQGWSPTGSLGQYGWNQYKAPTQQTTRPQFTQEHLAGIQDTNLKNWLAYYLSKSGLMQGSAAKPW